MKSFFKMHEMLEHWRIQKKTKTKLNFAKGIRSKTEQWLSNHVLEDTEYDEPWDLKANSNSAATGLRNLTEPGDDEGNTGWRSQSSKCDEQHWQKGANRMYKRCDAVMQKKTFLRIRSDSRMWRTFGVVHANRDDTTSCFWTQWLKRGERVNTFDFRILIDDRFLLIHRRRNNSVFVRMLVCTWLGFGFWLVVLGALLSGLVVCMLFLTLVVFASYFCWRSEPCSWPCICANASWLQRSQPMIVTMICWQNDARHAANILTSRITSTVLNAQRTNIVPRQKTVKRQQKKQIQLILEPSTFSNLEILLRERKPQEVGGNKSKSKCQKCPLSNFLNRDDDTHPAGPAGPTNPSSCPAAKHFWLVCEDTFLRSPSDSVVLVKIMACNLRSLDLNGFAEAFHFVVHGPWWSMLHFVSFPCCILMWHFVQKRL